MAKRYRKKPVEIEALQFTGHNHAEIQSFIGDRSKFHQVDEDDRGDYPEVVATVWDKLHSTWVGVKAGQWIIRGVQGEFYPCDAEVFTATYDEVMVGG